MSNRKQFSDNRVFVTFDNDNIDISSVIPLAETDGTLKTSKYGKDSDGTLTAEVVVGKNLGVSEPGASAETTLYTVPASTKTEVEKIVVTNRGGATTFTLGIAIGGGSLADEDHIADAADIATRATVVFCGPFYMTATDVIRIESASGNVAFKAYGKEYS